MDNSLHQQIKAAAEPCYPNEDMAHDFLHIQRVVRNAMTLQEKEGGDLDIILAAAYFHDCIKFARADERYHTSNTTSADRAEEILLGISDFPAEKIPQVKQAIIEHSYSAHLPPTSLESAILQDADRLEGTGAVAIMRHFAATGHMKCPFYDVNDPFKENTPLDERNVAMDMFFTRFLHFGEKMNTKTARDMAVTRTQFMENFLVQVGNEIGVTYTPRP